MAGGRPPLEQDGPPLKKIEKKFGHFGAPGASDLEGGHPGDDFHLIFSLWDALEPEL